LQKSKIKEVGSDEKKEKKMKKKERKEKEKEEKKKQKKAEAEAKKEKKKREKGKGKLVFDPDRSFPPVKEIPTFILSSLFTIHRSRISPSSAVLPECPNKVPSRIEEQRLLYFFFPFCEFQLQKQVVFCITKGAPPQFVDEVLDYCLRIIIYIQGCSSLSAPVFDNLESHLFSQLSSVLYLVEIKI
jgi:hypothetical protein